MINTLYSYDFDNTLIQTPEPELGKKIWLEKTGTEWPYKGWWSKSESLDINIFEMNKNEWVYGKYLESISQENSYNIMATGRLDKIPNMRKNVEKILNKYNLSFDEIHLNNLGDTFDFKIRLFEDLMKKTKCNHFVMYDDRQEHIIEFNKWARNHKNSITVVDVINRTSETHN